MKAKRRAKMQPTYVDSHGVLRFRQNDLVKYLVEWARTRGCTLNDLGRIAARPEDRDQFTQLIGYSVSGAPFISKRAMRKRDKIQARFERSLKR